MEDKQLTTSNKFIPIIFAILGTLYGVSPIDAVPDVIPAVGWIDDIIVMGGSFLNLAQAFTKDTNLFFSKILGLFKWLIILVFGILLAILTLLGTTIYQLLN